MVSRSEKEITTKKKSENYSLRLSTELRSIYEFSADTDVLLSPTDVEK